MAAVVANRILSVTLNRNRLTNKPKDKRKANAVRVFLVAEVVVAAKVAEETKPPAVLNPKTKTKARLAPRPIVVRSMFRHASLFRRETSGHARMDLIQPMKAQVVESA